MKKLLFYLLCFILITGCDSQNAVGPDDDDIALFVYSNLGLAYYNLGRYSEAVRAFLRALDGNLGSKEQALSFLVTAAVRLGRYGDGLRFLTAYENHFGEHQHGWTQADLERTIVEQRKSMARVIAC